MAELSLAKRRAIALSNARALEAAATIEERPETGPRLPFDPGPSGTSFGLQPPPTPRPSLPAIAGRQLATGFGAPMDLAAAADNALFGTEIDRPLFGSERIADIMGNIAPVAPRGFRPEGTAEAVVSGAALAGGTLPGLGLAAKGLSKFGGPIGRAVDKFIIKPFKEAPVKSTALELAAGSGAEVAGEEAAKRARAEGRNEDAARAVAALFGGFGVAVVPTATRTALRAGASAAKLGGRVALKVGEKLPLSGFVIGVGRSVRARAMRLRAGPRVRASDRLRDVSGEPDAIAARVTPEGGIAGQSQAVESGDPGLMAIERSILDADAKLRFAASERTRAGADALRESLRAPAQGATAAETRSFIGQQRAYLDSLLDQRVLQAQELATQRVAALGPNASEEATSRIVREEIQSALDAVRKTEERFWLAVPDNVLVRTTKTKKMFEFELKKLTDVNPENMPAKARFFLKERKPPKPGKKPVGFGDEVSVKRMRSLMSDLREEARELRAAKKGANRARIADEIAEAISEDLQAIRIGGTFDDAQDAFETGRDLDQFFARFAELETQVSGFPKKPVTRQIIGRGGIDPESVIAGELRAAGITSRTHPGLFRKGGLRDVDNIPFDEIEDAFDRGLARDGEFADRQGVLDELVRESGGQRSLNAEQQVLVSEFDELQRQLPEMEQLRADIGPERTPEPFPGDFGDVEVAEPLQRAIAYTRDVKAKFFKQGTVGTLLGKTRQGGEAVPTDLTLGRTIDKRGLPAKVSLGEIRAALEAGESARAGQGLPPGPQRSNEAMQDFLRGRFEEFTSPRGEFKPDKATDFVRRNGDLLDGFPELKRAMLESAEAGQLLGDVRATVKGIKKDVSQSTVSRFAAADAGQEFAVVFKSPDSRAAARTLAREAAKDPTGRATLGLKAAAIDYLERTASRSGALSGKALRAAVQDKNTRGALGEVLSPDDLRHIGRVIKSLENAETAAGNLPKVGGVLNDPVNRIIDRIARILAAGQGTRIAQFFGRGNIQVPGMLSEDAKLLVKGLTNDSARAMIVEAMQPTPEGRELFKALLMPFDTPARAAKVERALTPFLGPALGAQAGQTVAGEREGPGAPHTSSIPLGKPSEGGPRGALEGDLNIGKLGASQPLPPLAERVVQVTTSQDRNLSPVVLARSFVGAGEKKEAAILSAFLRQMTGSSIDPLQTPWSAAFINATLKAGGIEGTGSPAVRSFLKFGTPAKKPRIGDIAVFSDGNASARAPNVNLAFEGLLERGFSEIEAAGIVGNFMQESMRDGDIRPTISGDNGNAFGIAQWNGSRMRDLLAWAESQGKDPREINTQLDFFVHELGSTEKRARKSLGSAKTIEEATLALSKDFFRAGDPRNGNRLRNALGLSGGQGHVGFFMGEVRKNGQTFVRVLGGDQNNAVNEQLFLKSRLLAYRRPPKLTPGG